MHLDISNSLLYVCFPLCIHIFIYIGACVCTYTHVFLCLCMWHMYIYSQLCRHIWIREADIWVSSSTAYLPYLHSFIHSFTELGPSLNLEFVSADRLKSEYPGIGLSPTHTNCTKNTFCHIWLLCGCWVSEFMIAQKVLYPISHLPITRDFTLLSSPYLKWEDL